ncbi:hypothetical protein EVG20_g3194 [Dentipellis fragilis]|uniref:Uncharacterized protein n=1 Tax=Dentipellis fragilis TaxID=205917 RepID=A0A4Y9Z649_9AGAM|nr:hypothetical protein EVG20_g3194 [Dentipellis fragilis]
MSFGDLLRWLLPCLPSAKQIEDDKLDSVNSGPQSAASLKVSSDTSADGIKQPGLEYSEKLAVPASAACTPSGLSVPNDAAAPKRPKPLRRLTGRFRARIAIHVPPPAAEDISEGDPVSGALQGKPQKPFSGIKSVVKGGSAPKPTKPKPKPKP